MGTPWQSQRIMPRRGGGWRVWDFVRRYGEAYLFISPFYLLYALFGLYPLAYSLALSFHSWNGMGTWTWVGIGNYEEYIIRDPVFRQVLGNTLLYWVMLVPGMLFMALFMAMAVNLPRLRLKGIFRTSFILPYVTSSVSVVIVFLNILDDQVGWLNHVFGLLGMARVPFLRSMAWSKVSVSLLVIWQWVGYNMVIMLAGLQSIPQELYEAGMIDGANGWRRFAHITLPLMRPVLLFAFVMSTIGTFNMFSEPFLLTRGGPGNSSATLTTLLYSTAFSYSRFGAGAALSFIIAALIFAASAMQIKLSTREA
ncbi:MAG: carbohydrate ABC transporter permease [Anaerolineae bacterium]